MNNLTKKLAHNRIILGILSLYFIVQLINLTILPIFNDESIYLDWGWSFTHMPGHLYDSLLDAKQPLMIWLYGFFENFFSDPLVAGRFVGVIFGTLTAWGIFTFSEKLFSRKIAYWGTIIYTVTPYFMFYNRQALFEPAVACVALWSGIWLFNLLEKPSIKNALFFGLLLGIGFSFKTTFSIFIVSASLLLTFLAVKKRKIVLVKMLTIAIGILLIANFLLLINPLFWQTLSSNSRYAFSLNEIMHFPFVIWWKSLSGFLEISFVFLSPIVFILSFLGTILIYKKGNLQFKMIILYFLLSLILEIFLVKGQNQRYLTPFLPFFIIPAGYLVHKWWEGGIVKKSIVFLSLAIPTVLTVFLLVNPYQYIFQLSKYSQYAETGYISRQTSGYGINQLMKYIHDHSNPQYPTMVLFGLNAGNPENAVDVYSEKSNNLYSLHFDASLFEDTSQIKCLTSKYPLYLITREDQTVGMGKYFIQTERFYVPDKSYYIGLYTLNNNCKGKSFSLSDIYEPSMMKISEMKLGY